MTPPSRTHNIGDVGLLGDELPPWDQGAVDPNHWFSPERRDHPLDVEIGAGKGTFLVRAAAADPGANFLGIEYARAYWRHAADRCRRHGLENVRLIRTEAEFFLRHYMPDRRVRHVHIYFPDPWPKARHHKRRLIQEPFLRTVHRITREGSLLRIVTDHADYFAWIQDHLRSVADLFEAQPWTAFESGAPDEHAGTNFERKYRKEARTIHAVLLERRGART